MNRVFHVLRHLPILLLMSPLAFSQTAGCEQTLLVNAINSDQRRVAGLTKKDFSLNDTKTNIEISGIDPEPLNPRILILLDTSESMGQGKVRESTKFAILDFIEKMPLQIQLGFMTFADQSNLETMFTTDREKIRDSVNSQYLRPPKGRTHLTHALEKALQVLSPFKPGDAIVLFSDGDSSGLDQAKLKEMLIAGGVRMYAQLWLWNNLHATVEELHGPDIIRAYAEYSGGTLFSISPSVSQRAQENFGDIDLELIGRILYPYRLRIKFQPQGRAARIKMRLAAHSSVRSSKIAFDHPRELLSCAPQP